MDLTASFGCSGLGMTLKIASPSYSETVGPILWKSALSKEDLYMASSLQDFKGIVHTTIEILLSFIHPNIDSLDLHDFQRENLMTVFHDLEH